MKGREDETCVLGKRIALNQRKHSKASGAEEDEELEEEEEDMSIFRPSRSYQSVKRNGKGVRYEDEMLSCSTKSRTVSSRIVFHSSYS